MQENTGLTLGQIAEADRIRQEEIAARRAHTLQKHGRKGSRQWGFMTSGNGGKKGKRA